MFETVETFILGLMQTVFDQSGWAGVFALMAFENATGITPSEIILTFAGWMLIAAHELPAGMIFVGGLAAALGSSLGASAAYWAARLGGRPLVEKAARLFRLDPLYITSAEGQIQRGGGWMVLVARLIPGVRTLISIPAGLARMPFAQFLAATFAGTYIWCTLFIGAGYLLGHEWRLVSGLLKQYLPYLLGIGLAALAFIVFFRRQPRLPVVRSESE